jgi:hypothetical protein
VAFFWWSGLLLVGRLVLGLSLLVRGFFCGVVVTAVIDLGKCGLTWVSTGNGGVGSRGAGWVYQGGHGE